MTFKRTTQRHRRRAAVLPVAILATLALLGVTGLAIDVGLIVVACQQCQVVSDGAALGGAQELPDAAVATATANDVAAANVPANQTDVFTVTTCTYSKDEEIPGAGPAPVGGALEVTAAKQVSYHFLCALGFEGITVQRSATATKVVTGTCVAPMWIWHTTPVEHGQQVNLLMAAGPNCGIPGSFGFLQPNDEVDFQDMLKGTMSPEEEELQRVYVGEHVWANTGLAVAHWRGPLETDWNSRLERASWSPWSGDTFTSFHADNPRILIVPFVEYVDGTGSNARFVVREFGAFWLEDVITQGEVRQIQGRFIDFTRPGGTGSGIRPTHLVR